MTKAREVKYTYAIGVLTPYIAFKLILYLNFLLFSIVAPYFFAPLNEICYSCIFFIWYSCTVKMCKDRGEFRILF